LYEAGGVAFGSKSKPLSGEVDADLLGTSFLLIQVGADLKLDENTYSSEVLKLPRYVPPYC
jgi:hypothetical protein